MNYILLFLRVGISLRLAHEFNVFDHNGDVCVCINVKIVKRNTEIGVAKSFCPFPYTNRTLLSPERILHIIELVQPVLGEYDMHWLFKMRKCKKGSENCHHF